METVYRHEDGSLYIEIESQCLNGIFKLQMVHPNYGTIDPYWFHQEIKNRSVVELHDKIKKKSFITNDDHLNVEDIDYSSNSIQDHDCSDEDIYENDDYDVPPGYMDDCPPDRDPDNWREFYTGG